MNENFIAGKPVRGDNLIGREQEIQYISNYLKNGDSVVLMAPRRFGKTSIILEILDRLKEEKYFSGYIDIFTVATKYNLAEEITRVVLANKKLDSFINNIKGKFADLLKNIEFKHVIEDFEFVLDYRNEIIDEHKLLKNSIEFVDLFAMKHDNKIVLAFDEFADIYKFDGKEITKLLRSIIQLQENSSYIFSGSYESLMHSLFIRKSSPFYRFAKIIELGFIDNKSFNSYLTKQFKLLNIKIQKEAIAKILDVTKGHPFYTQLLAQVISFANPAKVNGKDIPAYLEESLWVEKSYFENIWSELSKSKELLEVLLCLAEGQSPYKKLMSKSINIARAIINLKAKGIIGKNKSGIIFYDVFLLYWLQKYILKTNIKI